MYRGNNYSSAGSRRYGRGGRGFSRNRRSQSSRQEDYTKYIKKAVPKKLEEYVPMKNFADFNLNNQIKKNIELKGYKSPTPIQDRAIDPILEGRDFVGIANTGTGKTAAFLLPLINKVMVKKGERILILVPTRELANQIFDEFRTFSKFTNVYATIIIGGESIRKQIFQLRRNPQFIIGTPGRISDLYERGAIELDTFNTVVLDEVDRMMDMGFIDDMRFILGKLKSPRQSLFFSATLSNEIARLVNEFLSDPVKVSVKTQPTSDNIEQDIVKYIDRDDKIAKLKEILNQEEVKKVIIFVKTKIEADRIDNILFKDGYQSVALHGDKSQFLRHKAVMKFKQGLANILVATDVAARGLDIPSVSHVINFDVPENYDDYVHRIGRTGRANETGVALTFVK